MYRASPPALGAGAHPLRISGAARRVFGEHNDSVPDPAYRAYLTDMVRPYGLSVHSGALDDGSGQSYGDMAEPLLRQLAPPDQPVDLLVMAFAVPDVTPWQCTASQLSHRCPGSPMAFAVCDSGTTAAFTGLRLIRAQAAASRGGDPPYPPRVASRGGDPPYPPRVASPGGGTGSPRALLVVVEQAAVHHELPFPATMPARHAAVALRCDPAGSSVLDSVRLRMGVVPAEVGSLLAAGLAELSAGHEVVTVIAGTGLADGARRDPGMGRDPGGGSMATLVSAALPAAAEVVIAPAGQPCTGVWWEVAGRLDEWAVAGRRVLVADYDPLPGSLCLAAIDVAGPSWATPR